MKTTRNVDKGKVRYEGHKTGKSLVGREVTVVDRAAECQSTVSCFDGATGHILVYFRAEA